MKDIIDLIMSMLFILLGVYIGFCLGQQRPKKK